MFRGIVGLIVGSVLVGIVSASAASLIVDGGTLQAFVVTPDIDIPEPPPAPTGVTCTKDGGTGTLEWEPVEGATGYRVYNSPGGDDYELYLEVTAPDTEAVVNQQLGHYFVVATYIGDLEGEPSEAVGCTPGHGALQSGEAFEAQGIGAPALLAGPEPTPESLEAPSPPTAIPTATPTATAEATAEATQEPAARLSAPDPEPEVTSTPTSEPTPEPAEEPTPTPEATPEATPAATSTPEATAEPTPEATSTPEGAEGTPEPDPTATETPEATPEATSTPDGAGGTPDPDPGATEAPEE